MQLEGLVYEATYIQNKSIREDCDKKTVLDEQGQADANGETI